MSDIFISYRRQDSAGFTRTLGKKLVEHYGEDSIFRDLEDIEAGDDFVDAIEEAVSSCKVLIAIVGPHWSKMENKQGLRRLDNPNDFVRLEIESALKRDIPVLPVTVNGAAWPPAEVLPESMQVLLRHQAHDLSDKQGRWDYDVEQLTKRLDKIDGITAITSSGLEGELVPTDARKSTFKPKLMLGLGAAIIAVLGIANFMPDPGNNPVEEKVDTNKATGAKLILAAEQTAPIPVTAISGSAAKQDPAEAQPVQKEVQIVQTKPVQQEPDQAAGLEMPAVTLPSRPEVKFIDISGNWRDRWGVMHYVEMTDKTHFIAMSEGVTAEGVINGKQIQVVTNDGGFGKYRLSNIGNHISGKFYASEGAEGEEVVLMRVK